MNGQNKNWDWWVILLWAYSTLVSLALAVMMIFFASWLNSQPQNVSSDQETIVLGSILFAPQLIFLIYIGIKNLKNR